MRTLRMVAGLAVGFLCAGAIARLAFTALQSAWPEYAAAAPERAFTLPMLWSRLGVAASLTVASGAAAVLVAGDRRAAWVLGSLFVLVSLPSHLYYVWADYPVWYHAVYLLSLVPLAWLGGMLVPSSLSQPFRSAIAT
jgi:hypothetical protein